MKTILLGLTLSLFCLKVEGMSPPMKCPQVLCLMYCENGFEKDANGCDTCKCKQETCKPVRCRMFCKGGRIRDENGCETCSCIKPDTEEDICTLPKEVGRCRALHIRWYFDTKQGKCVSFNYGGCGGNKNNFRTKQECKEKCDSKDVVIVPNLLNAKKGPSVVVKGPVSNPTVCQQPKATGPCEAAMTKWFYNKDTKECQTFMFGGCQGNDNNFNSKIVCEQTCMKDNVTPVETHTVMPPMRKTTAPEWFKPEYNYSRKNYYARKNAGKSGDKIESVKKLANLAKEHGIMASDGPYNTTSNYHPEYPENMKVCLCY